MAFALSDHDGLPREAGVIDMNLAPGRRTRAKSRERLDRS